jgi:hypothetical protein
MSERWVGLAGIVALASACAHATGGIEGGDEEGATGAGGAPKSTAAVTTSAGGAGGARSTSGAGGPATTTSTRTFDTPCPAVQSCATQGSTDTCTDFDSGWDKLSAQAQCGTSYKAAPCDPTGAIGGCLQRDGGKCTIVWYYPPTYVQSTIDALCTGLGKEPVHGPPTP